MCVFLYVESCFIEFVEKEVLDYRFLTRLMKIELFFKLLLLYFFRIGNILSIKVIVIGILIRSIRFCYIRK